MEEGVYLAELVFDANGHPVDWRFLAVNPAYLKIEGRSRTEVVGHTVREMFPNIEQSWFDLHVQTALSGKSSSMDGYFAGTGRHYSSHYYSPQRGQFACIFRDITAQKTADALRERNRKQQILLRELLEIILQNQPLSVTLGRCLDKILTVSWLDLLPMGGIFTMNDEQSLLTLRIERNLPAEIVTGCAHVTPGQCSCGLAVTTAQIQYDGHIENCRPNQEGGLPQQAHISVPLIAGQQICGVLVLYLASDVHPDFEHDNFLSSIAGILSSYIRRESSEQQLAHQREHLEELVKKRTDEMSRHEARTHAVLRCLNEGVVQFDATGVIKASNEAMETLFGYAEDDLLGKHFNLLIAQSSDSADDSVSTIYKRTHQFQRTGQCGEIHGQRKDGSTFPLELMTKELIDDQGSIFIGVLRDISVQKASATANEEARANAENLARVKSEFLANMSHEIRTPLNAVLGLAQIGARKHRDEEVSATFERILNSGQILLSVVNDILDFSKIDAGRMLLENIRYDLGQIIDQAVDMNARNAYAKRLEFRVVEQPYLPSACIGDPTRITQVLSNLLTNAVKFTEHGVVTLSVTANLQAMIFRIVDTGIGMTAEQIDQLFQPFGQADRSTTRRFGGTGLGLTISHRLVELMGGTIQVQSQPNKGSQFEVCVPIAPASPSALTAGAPQISLHGFDFTETAELAAELQAHGSHVTTTTPPLSIAQTHDSDTLFVIDYPCIANSDAIRTLLATGSINAAIICSPLQQFDVADKIRQRVPLLLRPIRARQILNLKHKQSTDKRSEFKPRLSGVRILAAEDNQTNQLVLKEILDHEGAALVIVENGNLACNLLIEQRLQGFDIVITDIRMPIMDGYETARLIKTMAPDLPVIGLTAHALVEEQERGLSAGMSDCLSKPVEVDELVATILRLLPNRPASLTLPSRLASLANKPDLSIETSTARDAISLNDTSKNTKIIDFAALEARYPSKPDFLAKLYASMLDSQKTTPSKLTQATRDGDFATLTSLAHNLKGAASNLMAETVRTLAQQTELASRSEDPKAFALAQQLSENLETLLATLTHYVKRISQETHHAR